MKNYSFGNFLYELRMRAGLTQYQLGALVGVSDKAVSKWENGLSKPQTELLYKLSEVLGISVDELLTCKYHSLESKNAEGVFAMKKELWNKAFDQMTARYGRSCPIEITNRFFTEQAEMQGSDIIVYFDMLSLIVREAERQGEHIWIGGGTGASFTAYVMGVTDVNPLKAHYYCPECGRVVFDASAADGWDLPVKRCVCGKEMKRDGHNIPFETYRHVVRRNTGFGIWISPQFLPSVIETARSYFKDHKTEVIKQEEGEPIIFRVHDQNKGCNFSFFPREDFTRCKKLEQITATSFSRVDFAGEEVLSAFRSIGSDSVIEFKNEFVKNILKSAAPSSFGELMQVFGLSHGTGVWFDNAEKLVGDGFSLNRVIAYRDDVYNYVRDKLIKKGLADGGFAYKVMEDTRRGTYLKGGIPVFIRSNLRSIDAEEWFVNSLSKIGYLFPKAHAVNYMKLAAIQMWYKINYPKEFDEVMK
ncbi:MAG: helix-turn-helix domain-containing protein [Clostridia bacterium]|nr:helix-turn-helix domain-containing protein [Clostridia bacterium]